MQEFIQYFVSGESPLWYFASIPAGVLLCLTGLSGLVWRFVSESREKSAMFMQAQDDYEFDLR